MKYILIFHPQIQLHKLCSLPGIPAGRDTCVNDCNMKKCKPILPLALVLGLQLLSFSLLAQQVTVTGTITNEKGEPLPGVTVSLK